MSEIDTAAGRATVADLFPERPLWRDVDRVKNTPHMNWGDCSCSQCCIWRIVARLDDLRARLAEVEALCQRNFNMEDYYEIDANDVIAAVRGEGDRPAETSTCRCAPKTHEDDA